MAPKRAPLAVPTSFPLRDALRIPSASPSLLKCLLRLSRASLLTLVLEWLEESNLRSCKPYLQYISDDENEEEEEEGPYPPAQSVEELRELYEELLDRKGGKREIIDRILEGDWRHGLSLRQLAMLDMRWLNDDNHPTTLRWTALSLTCTTPSKRGEELPQLPRISPTTMLLNLQREIGGLMKAHYHIHRFKDMPLTLLRIAVADTPYNTSSQHTLIHAMQMQPLFVAFPDNAPYIYISAPAGHDLHKMLLHALPLALSKPHERYKLVATALSTKTLAAMLAMRGGGRANNAQGGWAVYADDNVDGDPLDSVSAQKRKAFEQGLPIRQGKENAAIYGWNNAAGEVKKRKRDATPSSSLMLAESTNTIHQPKPFPSEHQSPRSRRHLLASSRFGTSAVPTDRKGIETLTIRIEEKHPLPGAADVSDSEADRDGLVTAAPAPQRKRPSRGRRSLLSNLEHESVASANDEQLPRHRQPQHQAEEWRTTLKLSLMGSHVFAGIRKLVEIGAVDGNRMPGWMTGQGGVSDAVVREGKIVGISG